MKVDLFDYDLPPELIAQKPVEPRDHSRLLVVDPVNETMEDHVFYELLDHLHSGDVMVVNHSKVIPARLYGTRESGGSVELLLLKRLEIDIWECLVKPGRKVKPGTRLQFGTELRGTCLQVESDGNQVIQFYYEGVFEELLDRLGEMPLPPYITDRLSQSEQNRYQTVYRKEGESVAAPTAGLHFTEELLQKIQDKGVIVTSVMLNVGLGTFRPVKTSRVEDHQMHEEYFEITQETADIINLAKAQGRRVIGVGTTTIRVLESSWRKHGMILKESAWTDIFITPGYQFQVLDGLVTNFHLPQSTLIMLISAFMGRELTLKVYQEAIDRKYRFFSFGDAMFIQRGVRHV